jgi:CheY-like chemotaxis protein
VFCFDAAVNDGSQRLVHFDQLSNWRAACFVEEAWGESDAIGGIVSNSNLSNRVKLLLVDDERQQLELRACVLNMAGFLVFSAPGPVEALSLASTIGDLDIAILDYEMPIMNGCVLAKHLKASFPKLITVLYSGAATIPCNDLKSVDSFISKNDGIPALLQHLSRLSADPPVAVRRPAGTDNQSNNSESPPSLVRSEPNYLPTRFGLTTNAL